MHRAERKKGRCLAQYEDPTTLIGSNLRGIGTVCVDSVFIGQVLSLKVELTEMLVAKTIGRYQPVIASAIDSLLPDSDDDEEEEELEDEDELIEEDVDEEEEILQEVVQVKPKSSASK